MLIVHGRFGLFKHLSQGNCEPRAQSQDSDSKSPFESPEHEPIEDRFCISYRLFIDISTSVYAPAALGIGFLAKKT